MFSLFKKKDINLAKVDEFCQWFIQNEKEIRESVLNSRNDRMKMMEYLDLFENKLANVFSDFYKGEINFGYGPKPKSNKWMLDLCHFNKKPLIKITSIIQEKLNNQLGDIWDINIMK